VVSVYERAELAPGAAFGGPALVLEAHSATVVGEGWRGRVDGARALVLERV
jgi:N-methylhydantoinase A/oxoprolinase/acetone carboxylase beta subunit